MNPHFISLILGLGAQAESALEGNLPPGAAEVGMSDARRMAQGLIDALIALEEKTRGNRDPDEEEILRNTLANLQTRFATNPGGLN